MSSISLLNELNSSYAEKHTAYENYFWQSYMWDKAVDDDFVRAKSALDDIRGSKEYLHRVELALQIEENLELRKRFEGRKSFFELYQTPDSLVELRDAITALEKKIESQKSDRTYGYTDPYTWEFVAVSDRKMRTMMRTEDDEIKRKAFFEGFQRTAADDVDDLIELVGMRNEYARALWFRHFYDYKAHIEEKMTPEEIRKLFDDLYEHAKPAYEYVRNLEKEQPGLRQPWNYGYMMSGDFVKLEDPYLQLENMLSRRGQSFAALGVNFRGATLQLDLLERKWKYNNGFCHMPRPVYYNEGKREECAVNFTCTALPWQLWDGVNTWNTLFHEWWHAAHFANMDMQDVFYNTEYPPASTAWAETQSQFMDTMFSSIERKMRYAKNAVWESYPWSIFEAKVRKFQPLAPRGMMWIACIVELERIIYQTPQEKLSKEFVVQTAKDLSVKYFDYESPDLFPLMPVHLYAWESACSYHGYGLADLWVEQWRKYRYEKDWYIVDNSSIWPAMAEVWKRWSAKSMNELMLLATWEKLSSEAYIEIVSRSVEDTLAIARQKIEKMQHIPLYTTPVDLWASISLVHGKEQIADNSISFEDMCERYSAYLLFDK